MPPDPLDCSSAMQMRMSRRLCRRSIDSSTRKNFPLFSQQSVTGYDCSVYGCAVRVVLSDTAQRSGGSHCVEVARHVHLLCIGLLFFPFFFFFFFISHFSYMADEITCHLLPVAAASFSGITPDMFGR